MAVFIAVFKVFVLLQLELLCTHSYTPPKAFVIALVVVFLFHATQDAAASYDRHSHLRHTKTDVKVIFSTEAAMILFDILFAIGSLGGKHQ
jgi:hypothetical protein